MASWKENMGRMAQSAMAKSKEMAEITRLNLDISNLEQKVKDLYSTVGQYILEHPEIMTNPDETVDSARATLTELTEKIELDRKTILDVRNVNVCPNCGAEVSRASKFCDRCGSEMVRQVIEQAPAACTCPNCGAVVDKDALFCGSCGSKIEK